MSSIFKKYTIAELIKIAPCQVLYKVLLFKEKFFVKLFPAKWKLYFPKKNIDYTKFNDFYSRCNGAVDEICAEVNAILEGKIRIFNKIVDFNYKTDWLNDPLSKNKWSPNVFCMQAPVVQTGCYDVKFVLEVNKMNHLVRVALAYYHTKEEKYIDYIDYAIKSWMEQVVPGRSIANRIMMDLGFRIINLIQIILLCEKSEGFNKRTLPKILGIIKEHVDRIHLFSTPRWFKTGNGMNHVTGEMIGLILGQQCLQAFGIKSYKRQYRTEYKYLIEVLDRTIAPSGAYLEQSSNYTRVVAEFMVCFEMFRKAFGNGYSYPKYEEGEYTKRLLVFLSTINYHGYLPNIGDNDDARVLVAFKKNDEDVEYIFDDESHNKENKDYLDGSQWIYRSSDENDIFIHTRIGKFTNVNELGGTHAHNDILSINLGIKGQPLFIDKGCRFYNSGIDIIREDRSITSHNTISINGVELNNIYKGFYSDYPQSQCITDIKHKNGCAFCGKLIYRGIEHTRRLEYKVKKLIVEDYINTNDSNSKNAKIRYMLHPDVIIDVVQEEYILKNKEDKPTVKIKIEGVEQIDIITEDYAPRYANIERTYVIEGVFKLQNCCNIKTIIEIL